jgi:hypothetical protein
MAERVHLFDTDDEVQRQQRQSHLTDTFGRMGIMLAVDGGTDLQILGGRFFLLMVVVTVAQGENIQLASDTQAPGRGY